MSTRCRGKGRVILDIDEFSDAVAQIYDASLDADRWDDALDNLGRLFGSPKAQFTYLAPPFMDASGIVKVRGFSDRELEAGFTKYRELVRLADPRYPPPSFFKAFHCRQLVSDDELRSSAFYQQALAPAGVEYSLFFLLKLAGNAVCAVGLICGPGQEPFTAADCDELGRFIPHVSRAMTMHGAFHSAHRQVAAARSLIDDVPLGMIVVEDNEVVLTNAAARSLLEQGDSLIYRNGMLRAVAPQSDALLEQAMLEARSGNDEAVGVTLAAVDGGQVRAVARQLRSLSAGMLGANPASVALSDSRRPMETPEEVLRRMFGLTEREAAVLRALVRGYDTRRIAQRLGIGFETVKTHIAHILQTTGVGGQAQLVRLVLSSPAWIGTQRTRDAMPRSSGPRLK